MTTPGTVGALPAHVVHGWFGRADVVVAERRALLALAASTLGSGLDAGDMDAETWDDPGVRHVVGEALAGRVGLCRADVDRRAGRRVRLIREAGCEVRLAAGDDDGVLAAALGMIARQSGLAVAPGLLTEQHGVTFDRAAELVRQGVALAAAAAPELTADVLAHTSVVAVLEPAPADPIVSASSRWYPGLTVVDHPSTALEVAEALIHEGAHQKFFDLATVRQLLGDGPGDLVFRPSWSDGRWDSEQTLAAFHAYRCLAEFAVRLGPEIVASASPTSLLAAAEFRAREIGSWLVRHDGELRHDGRTFVFALLESLSGDDTPRHHLDEQVRASYVDSTGRLAVARPGPPPDLLWLEGDATDVVRALHSTDGLTHGELVARLVDAWPVDGVVARQRLSHALQLLDEARVVTTTW